MNRSEAKDIDITISHILCFRPDMYRYSFALAFCKCTMSINIFGHLVLTTGYVLINHIIYKGLAGFITLTKSDWYQPNRRTSNYSDVITLGNRFIIKSQISDPPSLYCCLYLPSSVEGTRTLLTLCPFSVEFL